MSAQSTWILIAAGILYLVPIAIAVGREHRNTMGIVLLDIFLGWTLIGWVAALVWSCLSAKPYDVESHDESCQPENKDRVAEIEKLYQLKTSGALTEEEYVAEKARVLG